MVGLISATTVGLLRSGLTDWLTVSVFAAAMPGFLRSKAKWTIPAGLPAAAALGTL